MRNAKEHSIFHLKFHFSAAVQLRIVCSVASFPGLLRFLIACSIDNITGYIIYACSMQKTEGEGLGNFIM